MKKTINQQKPPSAKYITFRMDDPDFSAKYLKMHLKRPELIEFLRELFGGGVFYILRHLHGEIV